MDNIRVFIYEHAGSIISGMTAVVAKNEEQALQLLEAELRKEGLAPSIDKVKELDFRNQERMYYSMGRIERREGRAACPLFLLTMLIL